jgi:hypothetical protein
VCYYLSLEFLMGRTLNNALLNLGLKDKYAERMKSLGFSMKDVLNQERDSAGEQRPRLPCRVLPRLERKPGAARVGVRAAVQVRDLPAADLARRRPA